MIDRSKGQPKYCQLRDILAKGIREGIYPVGTMLPSERSLEKSFSVSRVIVRKSLKELFAKGYLRKGPGARAVVGNPAPSKVKEPRIYGNMAFVSQNSYGSTDIYRLLYEAMMRECYQEELRLFYVDARKTLPNFLRETDFTALFIEGGEVCPQNISPLIGERTRLVAVDDSIWDDKMMLVGTDNFQCGALAAKCLLGRGCKRPLFVGAKHSYSYYPFGERKNGFANTLAEAGIPCEFFDVGLSEGGIFHLDELLAFLRTSKCDGIFAYHDSLALATLNVLLALGRKIPDDVALVGMDGLESGACAHPPLTTVAQPIDEIAKVAVREAASQEFQPRRILIPGFLITRQSA